MKKLRHFAFLSPPLWGLRDNVRCYLGLIEKCVVDFLLVIIELFLLAFPFLRHYK